LSCSSKTGEGLVLPSKTIPGVALLGSFSSSLGVDCVERKENIPSV
jgi:hypothetical protein